MCIAAVQQAEIPGPDAVFIQHGSTISLECEVLAGVEAVGLVRWYHGDKPLNYSSPRGGISMEVSQRDDFNATIVSNCVGNASNAKILNEKFLGRNIVKDSSSPSEF